MLQQSSFGSRLQELFRPNETQEEFGKRVGINRNTIASYLKNKDKKPDTDQLIKISRACNVSTDWLLGLTEPKSSDPAARTAAEYTGLCDKAIEILHKGIYPHIEERRKRMALLIPAINSKNPAISEIINFLLCERSGNDLIENIYEFFHADLSKLYTIDFNEPFSLEKPEKLIPNDVYMATTKGDWYRLNPELTGTIFLESIKDNLKFIKEEYYDQTEEGDS